MLISVIMMYVCTYCLNLYVSVFRDFLKIFFQGILCKQTLIKVNKNTRIAEGFRNRFNYYMLQTDMNTTVYRKCILKRGENAVKHLTQMRKHLKLNANNVIKTAAIRLGINFRCHVSPPQTD
uniref:Uncharacterized protein n=1 Tax=Glossina austeni TaxID=7395 RepID=A0A1A9V0G3_GLOAU